MLRDQLTSQDALKLSRASEVDDADPRSPECYLTLVEQGLLSRLQQTQRQWDEVAAAAHLHEAAGLRLAEQLTTFALSGGKRVRPRMCHLGWLAGGGVSAVDRGFDDLLCLGVALELLHCFGLVQDDVMDSSSTRRGRPAMHQLVAEQHARNLSHGDSEQFGESVAVLISDLALSQVYEVIMDLPATLRAAWQRLTLELIAGQSLDLIGAAMETIELTDAIAIARAKSGHYTVTRPLQLGALAAGAGSRTLGLLGRFGDHVGLAFALRDDLISVLGDPAETGKPWADDLRDRKPTVLAALAREAGLDLAVDIATSTGSTSGLDSAQAVETLIVQLREQGVLHAVETMIAEELLAAERVLDEGLASGLIGAQATAELRLWAGAMGRRQR